MPSHSPGLRLRRVRRGHAGILESTAQTGIVRVDDARSG